MIEKTLADIEKKLANDGSVNAQTRAELVALLSQLKAEIAGFSETHSEEAENIAGYAKASADVTIGTSQDPQVVKSTLEDLSESVSGFETSHPRLVETVNRICVLLSNLGI